MRLPAGVRRAFRRAVGRRDVARDVDEELAFHFGESVRALRDAGLSESEARREARRRFGDEAAYRRALADIDGKRVRREGRLEAMGTLWRDLRHAGRSVRRSPGFAGAVVTTLALGIGANAVMFGVVDRLLLSPPEHVRDAAAVRHVYLEREIFNGTRPVSRTFSYPDYLDLVGLEPFAAVAASATPPRKTLGRGEAAEQVRVVQASASLFPLLGVRPALGRFFGPEDDALGAPPRRSAVARALDAPLRGRSRDPRPHARHRTRHVRGGRRRA